MARVELIMPKMGESVSEATIITWTKEVGEHVELDETIVEIATDKVDSEVPSTHEGKLVEKLFAEDDLVQVGEAFAILEVDGGDIEVDDSGRIAFFGDDQNDYTGAEPVGVCNINQERAEVDSSFLQGGFEEAVVEVETDPKVV